MFAVSEELWFDDAGAGEWRVTRTGRDGQKKEYAAIVECCDEDKLDTKNVYACETKKGTDKRERIVVAIGDVIGTFE